MGKKGAALVCLVLVSLPLFAMDLSSGVRIQEYVSYTRISGFASIAVVKEKTLCVYIDLSRSTALEVSVSSQKGESVLNLDPFVSSGDFDGFSGLVGIKGKVMDWELMAGAGIDLVFPHSWSNGLLVVADVRACVSRTIVPSEGLKLTVGIPIELALDPTFLSFRAGLLLEITWQY